MTSEKSGESIDKPGILGKFKVMKTIVPCPQCKKRGEWFETKYGPFCSERCKLLDLGKWFSEENAISEPLRADHLEEYENLEGPELDKGEEK